MVTYQQAANMLLRSTRLLLRNYYFETALK
jgi:hypothetical protein